MKKNYLTKAQRLQFVIPENLKSILIGLLLGDLFIEKQERRANVRLRFEQSTVHEDYLFHLYDLFQSFCTQAPKMYTRLPDKRTGNIYSRILFYTYSLPCFNELHELFYQGKKKVVPSNIGDLLTPLSLAYFICDDGCFCKTNRVIYISTNSFSLEEVNRLIDVLKTKYNLECSINKQGLAFRIRISSKSIPVLQSLLKDIMPPMMLHKIGL